MESILRARLRLALGVALGLLAQGCSTTGQPGPQTLVVETPGCPAARCTLSNDLGHWVVARTPGTVSLTASAQPLKVECSTAEGLPGASDARARPAPMSAQGSVTGGLAGAGLTAVALAPLIAFFPPLGLALVVTGGVVGSATGELAEASRRALRYPDVIYVPMACSAAGPLWPVASDGRCGVRIRGLSLPEAVASGLGERTAVKVTDVAPGGHAAAMGLQAGDIVMAADEQPVTDAAQLEALLRTLPPGRPIVLLIRRGESTLGLAMMPPVATPKVPP